MDKRTLPECTIWLFSTLIHYYACRTKIHSRAVFFCGLFYWQR